MGGLSLQGGWGELDEAIDDIVKRVVAAGDVIEAGHDRGV